jgi:hypothetical protein
VTYKNNATRHSHDLTEVRPDPQIALSSDGAGRKTVNLNIVGRTLGTNPRDNEPEDGHVQVAVLSTHVGMIRMLMLSLAQLAAVDFLSVRQVYNSLGLAGEGEWLPYLVRAVDPEWAQLNTEGYCTHCLGRALAHVKGDGETELWVHIRAHCGTTFGSFAPGVPCGEKQGKGAVCYLPRNHDSQDHHYIQPPSNNGRDEISEAVRLLEESGYQVTRPGT